MAYPIELLSPAKNLSYGITAINHGADAVYIGGPKFGARESAGNRIEDIEALINYAHLYHARVYITLNTILYDNELEEVEKLIFQLYTIGADAIIIQDLGILEMNLPPIPIHASTQLNNSTPQKVKFLEDVGFSQVVLARELNLNQIKDISNQTTIPLEFFVHGSLCVSYSGQCYISQVMANRSGNRGACAQFCRHKYALFDANNQLIQKDKYLLSLKDLNHLNQLKQLIDAGISSFKIEGRLKDENYVKNVTASYRKELDAILQEKPQHTKSSSGKCFFSFSANPSKTFQRGETNYYLFSDKNFVANINTPKSTGELIAIVKEARKGYVIIDTKDKIANGDGICFFNKHNELEGFYVQKVEGDKLFIGQGAIPAKGAKLFRNFDKQFYQQLETHKGTRLLDLEITIVCTKESITLTLVDEDNCNWTISYTNKYPLANDQPKAIETIKRQFSKLGDTVFTLKKLSVLGEQIPFIPVSDLNEWRRNSTEELSTIRQRTHLIKYKPIIPNEIRYIKSHVDYLENISNKKTEQFFNRHGVVCTQKALEISKPNGNEILMRTKYCIKYELSICPVHQTKDVSKYKEPFYLMDNAQKYRLAFNCKTCEMLLVADKSS